MIKNMQVAELKRKMLNDEVLLIDVREPEEFAESSIPGSYLIPLANFCYDALPVSEKPIVIHCRSGKRSELACHKLINSHPDLEVYNLEGGILAWLEASQ